MQGKEITLTINGETKTLSEWSRIYGVNPHTTWGRLKKGADPLMALTAPPGSAIKKRVARKKRIDPREKCMKCQYRNYINHVRSKSGVYCEYMYHTGQKRPCPGSDCTVFVEGAMLPLKNDLFMAHERGWEG